MSDFGDSARSAIARQTTTFKLSVIRSQSRILSDTLDNLFGNLGESKPDSDLLKERIEALKHLPVAGAKAARKVVWDASVFLHHECVDGWPSDAAALQSWHERYRSGSSC